MGCTISSQANSVENDRAVPSEAAISKKNGKKKHPIVGPNSTMSKKSHGTSETPVQSNLRWGCDFKTADRICNYNRHNAEHSGCFQLRKEFMKEVEQKKKRNMKMTFCDSNSGKPLFTAPVNRSWNDFIRESKAHGWPSFRDDEVDWDNVRCLRSGEAVSLDGTHLGHNLPDRNGNRHCVNLVSTAGRPTSETQQQQLEENQQAWR